MTAATAYLHTIPSGDWGARTTLEHMRRIANASIVTPIVVQAAHRIVRVARERDYLAMSIAIRDFLASHFRFVPDPLNVELVRTPEFLLRQYDTYGEMSGDCDDVAVIGAALGKAVGIPAKYVAIGFRENGPLSHVYSILCPQNARGPISLDVTKPVQVVAQIRRRVVVSV